MKTTIQYQIEKTDPAWGKQISEAFNPLLEFAPHLRQHPDIERNCFARAFNRIVESGEWHEVDVLTLANYSKLVAGAARAKYEDGGLVGAPWRESVLVAADRLEFVVGDFIAWFERARHREVAA